MLGENVRSHFVDMGEKLHVNLTTNFLYVDFFSYNIAVSKFRFF